MASRRSFASRARNIVFSALSVVLIQTRAAAQASTQVPSCLPALPGCLQEETAGETPPDRPAPVDTLRDKSATFNQRAQALREICTNGPEESILAAFEILEALLAEVEAAPVERWHSDETVILNRTIIRHFMSDYLAPAQDILDDQRPLLALMLRIASSDVPHPAIHSKAIRAIALSAAPREARQEALLSLVERRPQMTGLREEIYPVFDASTFPRLRNIFRAARRSEEFHFLAAHILAYNGDQEILPELRTLLPELLDRSAKAAPYLEFDIWRIEVQHPPSRLIEYIASTGGWHARVWAVKRAAKLGLAKPEIRQAILMHATSGPPGEGVKRPEVMSLKRTGLELGILHKDDLPDVEVPDGRPTP